MGIPAGTSPPARYTVVPVIGPDGVGKTSLVRALGDYVGRRDGLSSPPLRAVSNATVLDARTAQGVFQLVDFASAAAQESLLGSSPFQGALLVVSAMDSVTSGTLQCLERARAVGIRRVATALTKCDLIDDPEMLDLITMEVRELLTKHEYGGDDAPVACLTALPQEREGKSEMSTLPDFFEAVLRWIP
jgi:hypothetical protein